MIQISNKSAQEILSYLADYATTKCSTLREREARRRARLLLNKLKRSVMGQIATQKATDGKLPTEADKSAKCPIIEPKTTKDV